MVCALRCCVPTATPCSPLTLTRHVRTPKERLLHPACGDLFLRGEVRNAHALQSAQFPSQCVDSALCCVLQEAVHMDGCEAATILCPHGCGKMVVRRDVERHLTDNPTVHELASTRSLTGVVSDLVERVDGMETKIDTLLAVLAEIRRLEEDKRALAVAQEVIEPLFEEAHSHVCAQCRQPCTTLGDQTCVVSGCELVRGRCNGSSSGHHCSSCHQMCNNVPHFDEAPAHCPKCDEFSARPYTTWQVWATKRTEATAVGVPGKVTRVSPDGKHSVLQEYTWLPGDTTPHQPRSRFNTGGGPAGDVKALDVCHPRILCACNRPDVPLKTTTTTQAGAGAGAGACDDD